MGDANRLEIVQMLSDAEKCGCKLLERFEITQPTLSQDVYKRQELDGVQSSVVNLMKQTLTINVAPAVANTIASQIETIVHSHEPCVEVQEETIIPVSYTHLLVPSPNSLNKEANWI